MMDEQLCSYLIQIEEHFSHVRKKGLILSPKDRHRIEKWQGDGIPLGVILRGINKSVEQADSDKDIRSLSYCEKEIKKEWKFYREQMEGAPSGEIDTGAEFKLSELKNCLESAIVENNNSEIVDILRQTCFNMQLLIDNSQNDWVEQLKRIISSLIDELKNRLSPDSLNLIEETMEKRLGEYKSRMTQEAYRETLDSLIKREVLEKYNLMIFSVFTD